MVSAVLCSAARSQMAERASNTAWTRCANTDRASLYLLLFCPYSQSSFTTVRHWAIRQPGEMASPPPAGSVNGHLPKVIKRLVQRRRNVKDMLKKENNAAKRAELDIRQKALKLVANAMYGCLGFVNSRFCTKATNATRVRALVALCFALLTRRCDSWLTRRLCLSSLVSSPLSALRLRAPRRPHHEPGS